MEASSGPGRPYPRLLDLIRGGGCWKEKGEERFKLAEQELELRLAPPSGEDWAEQKGPSSVLSLGVPPRASAGAKRGFSDALESGVQGFEKQQPKPSFLLPNGTGADAEKPQRHQNREGKTCSPAPLPPPTPASGKAAAAPAPGGSPARPAAAPVVGWPPIRSFRKNLTSSSSKPASPPRSGCPAKAEKQEISSKGKLVKINMDGVPIGRKVDLKVYEGYDKLSAAVDELFRGLLAAQKRETPASGNQDDRESAPGPVITGLLDGSGEYTLVYEDEEGDKLLVGDVPWEMFVSSVKRLRVLKSSDLSALSLAPASRDVPEPPLQ